MTDVVTLLPFIILAPVMYWISVIYPLRLYLHARRYGWAHTRALWLGLAVWLIGFPFLTGLCFRYGLKLYSAPPKLFQRWKNRASI